MNTIRKLAITSVSLAAMAAVATPASATEGYFQYGYGARQHGLAGAGVANGTDATTISLNPAGLVNVGNEASMAITVFSPRREVNSDSPFGFIPQGTTESGNNYFYIPNMAVSYRMAPGSIVDVVGVQMYGNGGMNTDYPARVGGVACPFPGFGIYCGGKAGVNLQQALLSVAMAKSLGNFSIGIAPTIARQQIEVEGLGAFAGFSNSPGAFSNSGTNLSWGFGVRGGIEWKIMPHVRLGVAGATPMWSTPFHEYRGLFAEGGKFDIPANLQAGIAVDLNPALTVMLDYRHIFYSGVASIANSSSITNCALAGGPIDPSCFGGANGPGFGWGDVDVFKIGVEYKANPALTLRAGYAYNTGAIKSRDVFFNTIAPAVVRHHITAGLEYKYNQNWSLELAGAYVPRASLTGPENAYPGDPTNITISMEQYMFTMGVKYKFGAPEPVYEPMK